MKIEKNKKNILIFVNEKNQQLLLLLLFFDQLAIVKCIINIFQRDRPRERKFHENTSIDFLFHVLIRCI